jgi:DNA transposition AAA+ family ATPase
MIDLKFKHSVVEAIKIAQTNFGGSNAKHATSLGISTAIYSRIINGETEKVMSDANWISLGRQLRIGIQGDLNWKTAETPVFTYITSQLEKCKKNSVSTLLVDLADIGKTYAAKDFAKKNKHTVYIDCSQVKSKQKLVRSIAKEFGVGHTGKYADVYEDLVYYLNSIARPLIILDEAGDLNYDAFLELKALWNATERSCGWAMIGADGLKEKVRRAIDNKKVGFTELFSRYGKKYNRISPEGKEEAEKFTLVQCALIIKANAPKDVDTKLLLKSTNGSLRRIYNELTKLNN